MAASMKFMIFKTLQMGGTQKGDFYPRDGADARLGDSWIN